MLYAWCRHCDDEIDGLQPVDSADFDVIRELRTELADLLE